MLLLLLFFPEILVMLLQFITICFSNSRLFDELGKKEKSFQQHDFYIISSRIA